MKITLIIECEHGRDAEHWENRGTFWCSGAQYHTDPDAILEALAEAGVLERKVDSGHGFVPDRVFYIAYKTEEEK